MRENGNILVWCDLMPRVNLMYCITIKNGVVIYSWGSSIYIFLWLLWGNKSIFKPKKNDRRRMKNYLFSAACRVIFHQVFVVAVCVAVLHLIAVAHNYSFPLEKHFFAEKKTCLIAAFKARETLREFLKPKSSVLCF